MSADLVAILATDAEVGYRIEELENAREENQAPLIALAREWIRLYGGARHVPKTGQSIGTCTACFINRIKKANDWPHRPLSGQECLQFVTDCGYDCGTNRVWIPTAWLGRQLRDVQLRIANPGAGS